MLYSLCVGFPTGWCIPCIYVYSVYIPPAYMQHTLISVPTGVGGSTLIPVPTSDGGFSLSVQKVGGLA